MQRPSFRSAFLAGPSTTWEVDPTTRCLTSPHPAPRLAAIAPLHAEHGGNLFRVFRRDDLGDVPRLTPGDLELVAKLEHELDHMQRHLATSYGLVHHLMRSRMVDLFFQRPSISPTDDAARLPWYPLHGRRARSSNPSIDRNERLFNAYRQLLQLLACDGASPISPMDRERRAAFVALVRDLFPQGLRLRPPRLTQEGCREWFPIWNNEDGRPSKMGAAGLLESFALSRELSLMHYAGLAEQRDTTQFGSSVYRQASYVWRKAYGLPHIVNADPGDGWRSLGIRSVECPPWEFQLAVDLALWIPLGPDGPLPANAEYGWEDVHPGCRFASLLTLLQKRTSWRAEPAITNATSDWVRETQTAWCRQLGWPSPDEILGPWLAWLVDGYHRRTLDRRFIEDDRSRLAASIKLLAARQSAPARVVLGYPDAAGSPVNWFDALFAPDETNVLHVYGDEARMKELEKIDYPFPVVYGVIQGIELFGEQLGDSVKDTLDWQVARLRRLGPRLEQCVRTYAKRNYNLDLEFAGRLPELTPPPPGDC